MTQKKKKAAPKRKPGRPAMDYSTEVGDRICKLIVEGKSLRRICLRKDMPSLSTAMKWLRESKEFAQQYAHARDSAGDTFADYIIDLVEKASERNYNSTRIKIDALKWVASKLKPKRYGDRLALDGLPTPAPFNHEDAMREAARRVIFMLELSWRGLGDLSAVRPQLPAPVSTQKPEEAEAGTADTPL